VKSVLKLRNKPNKQTHSHPFITVTSKQRGKTPSQILYRLWIHGISRGES